MRYLVALCTFLILAATSINPETVGTKENVPATDFSDLAGKAFPPEGGVNREYGDKLWSALYKLPHWYFLMTPKSMANKMPSAQVIDGKGWFLAFTDVEKLQAYARQNKDVDKKGNALYLAMSPEQAVEFARKNSKGPVFGVRFNEGQPHGWFAPMNNLTIFPNYLKNKGLL